MMASNMHRILISITFLATTINGFTPILSSPEACFSLRLCAAKDYPEETLNASSMDSLLNFRPIVQNRLCRSASLDDLSLADAESLMRNNGRFSVILDLRNWDEIKPERRSPGSNLFYDWLATTQGETTKGELQSRRPTQLIPIPILQDVNDFWDVTIDQQLSPLERLQATTQTIWQAGALDRAAARALESQQHFGLYKSMLQSSGGRQFGRALDVILLQQEQKDDDRPILLHCQKGKDRTGLLAMMLQHIVNGDDKSSIVEAYRLSEVLLGESPSSGKAEKSSSQNSLLDWSKFRGSPAVAMEQTLEWIYDTYGSMDGYLDVIGFTEDKRERLRNLQR